MTDKENETEQKKLETAEFVSMEELGIDPKALLEKANLDEKGSEVVAEEDWKIANYKDLDILKPSEQLRVERIIVDPIKKIQLVLYIRELSVIEHLAMMENFIKADRKSGTAKADLTGYYRVCWNKMVVDTKPPNVTWKMVKRFNRPFFKKIEEIFPKPTEDKEIGGLSTPEKGN